MTSNTLYIIGNGFDLHHRLPTQYWQFKNYLEKVDREVFDWVESYIAIDDEWAELELSLADLDTEDIVTELEGFLVPYSAEDWSMLAITTFSTKWRRSRPVCRLGCSNTLRTGSDPSRCLAAIRFPNC